MPSKFIKTSSSINKLILNRTYEDKFRIPPGIFLEGEFSEFYPQILKFFNDFPPRKIITVGDYVTFSFLNKGVPINIAIVDFKVERKTFKYDPTPFFNRVFRVNNPPGVITALTWFTIQYTFSLEESSLVIVDGEEDLLALPCVLCAPLNSIIFFGIPQRGLMMVNVNSEARDYALSLLSFFTPEYE
ncbi:MAG: GTP-dependent dephospho-CoA kinase family protein [Candidatus Methanomethylicia archaeon]